MLEAGAGRTAVGLVVLPSLSVAAGMHYLPDFRALVEETFPGATEALTNVTGVDYAASTAAADQERKGRSNLPPNYEKLPDIMNRIKKEKKSDSDSAAGYFSRAKAAVGAGEKERAEHSPKFVDGLETAAASAKAKADEAVAAVTGGVSTELKKAEAAGASGEKGYMESLKNAAAGLFGAGSGAATEAKKAAEREAVRAAEKGHSLAGDPTAAAAAAKSTADGALGSAMSSGAVGVKNAEQQASKLAKKLSDAESALASDAKQAAYSAGDAFGGLADKTSDALHSASDAVTSAASGAGEKFASVVHDAEESISSAAHQASDALHSTTNVVSSAAGGAGEKFMSVAHDAEDSIASVARKASAAAHDFADRATGTTGGSLFPSGASGSSGPIQSANDGSQGATGSSAPDDEAMIGTKLARLLGRGDYDPAAVEGKDVVDTNVYKRPSWSSSNATTPSRLSKGDASVPPATKMGFIPTAKSPEVNALQAELASQAKWDAVRLQEAVRAQSVADKKAASAELAAVMKKHKSQLAAATEEAFNKAQDTLAAKTKELETEMIQRRDVEVAKLLKEKEDSIKAAVESEYLERERKASNERELELTSLKASVDALNDDLDNSREHRKASQSASLGTAAAFSLKNALQGNGSFEAELANAARTSDLGKLVADSIPSTAGSHGLPTTGELKSSFQTVSLESRKAALIPERDVGTIWGHLLASIVSRLKVAVDTGNTPYVPFSNEERILVAEKHIGQGDLAKAVEMLSKVDGLAGDILSDWIAAAKARMAADLGSDALLADSILTQQSLAAAPGASDEPGAAECYF